MFIKEATGRACKETMYLLSTNCDQQTAVHTDMTTGEASFVAHEPPTDNRIWDVEFDIQPKLNELTFTN